MINPKCFALFDDKGHLFRVIKRIAYLIVDSVVSFLSFSFQVALRQ